MANINRHKEAQAKHRKEAKNDAQNIVSKIVREINASIWSQVKIADLSGLAPTTINTMVRGRSKSASLSTITGLARAMGYKLELVPLDKSEDPYYDERWVKKGSAED